MGPPGPHPARHTADSVCSYPLVEKLARLPPHVDTFGEDVGSPRCCRAWQGAGDGPVSRGHAVDRRPRPAVCTARSASAVRRAESHPVSHRPSGTARRGLLPLFCSGPRYNTRGEDW